MDKNNSINLKKLIFPAIGCSTSSFLIIFVVFVSALITLGIIESEAGDGSSSGQAAAQECGFTISKTSLSKSEYKNKLKEYAKSNPNFEKFATNADDIYEYAISKGVNPELVPIRAKVEGNGHETSGAKNNYWGIHCLNGQEASTCNHYDTFEDGYKDFINIASQYSSLEEMFAKYAYIGYFWYHPGGDGEGGCPYADDIFGDDIPQRVKDACSQSAPTCNSKGDGFDQKARKEWLETGNNPRSECTPTTDEDQKLYMKWQIKTNMASVRKSMFGLEFEDGPCTGGSSNSSYVALAQYTFNHEGLTVLNRSLTSSEISDLNNAINKEVDEAGYGTGNGVAEAGATLTDWLAQKGYYLKYHWGGGHGQSFVGVNSNWGSSSGMDCSGFVSWAIRTACTPNYGTKTTETMLEAHKNKIDILEAKPGDLMLMDGHVRLVIENNNDGSVIVAEEAGGNLQGLVFTKQKTDSSYSFIDMSDYYKNNCNSTR